MMGMGLSLSSGTRKALSVLLVSIMLSCMVFLPACGGGNGGGGNGRSGGGGSTPSGTYTITIKGTAGSRIHTTNATLTVQ
jgi:hypothetical protein